MARPLMVLSFACQIAICWPTFALADDEITLQVGRGYSLYAPPSCHKGETPNFDLLLNCDFHGKAAQFYVKAISVMHLHLEKYQKDAISYMNAVWLDVLRRGEFAAIGPRTRLLENTIVSTDGQEWEAQGWSEGHLYKSEETTSVEDVEKRIFLVVTGDTRRDVGIAVAFSDFDVRANGNIKWTKPPREVRTILGSLAPGSFLRGQVYRDDSR